MKGLGSLSHHENLEMVEPEYAPQTAIVTDTIALYKMEGAVHTVVGFKKKL